MKHIAAFITLLLCTIHLYAARHAAAADNMTDEASVSSHSILAGALPLVYKATAGYLTLKNEKGEKTARIFYVAYEKQAPFAGSRPVTFAFNGGPGAASVWLHLGALGPKKIKFGEDGTPLPPPVRIITNTDTWLRFTDLVFIDPVGTGYSRPAGSKDEKQFFDMKADIESVGDFIRLYLTKARRWSSPVYLCGESYGTTRAVGLLPYLHDKHGIMPVGVVLISPVLDFATISFQQTNDIAMALALPSYAAAAWYHRKNDSPDLQEALAAAEQYSLGQYLVALAQGRALGAEGRNTCAAKISGLAGVSPEYVRTSDLRMDPVRYRRELLRGQSRIIGRMDTRMTMPDTDRAADSAGADPALDRLYGPFAAAANDYLRRELKVKSDLPYWFLNGEVAGGWSWRTAIPGGQGYVNVTRQLTDALNLNPDMRVFIAAGIFDLATPYYATIYTINHLEIDSSRAGNVFLRTYPGGHMMYTEQRVLRQLSRQAAEFYRGR